MGELFREKWLFFFVHLPISGYTLTLSRSLSGFELQPGSKVRNFSTAVNTLAAK